jgi:23S rRNA G2069 N7-methylase RlmK/C1962 C5-methylase RlmI
MKKMNTLSQYTVILLPGKENSILRFHPWVFSGAIHKIVDSKTYNQASPSEGDVVEVVNSNNEFLGMGRFLQQKNTRSIQLPKFNFAYTEQSYKRV